MSESVELIEKLRKVWPGFGADRDATLKRFMPLIDSAIAAAEEQMRERCDKASADIGLALLDKGDKHGWSVCDDVGHAIRALPLSGESALERHDAQVVAKAQQEMRDKGFQHPDDVRKMILSADARARLEAAQEMWTRRCEGDVLGDESMKEYLAALEVAAKGT